MKKALITSFIIVLASAAIIIGNAYYARLVKTPEKAANYINLAETAIDSGDEKSAETNARLAISLNEKSGRAHFLLARSLSLNRSALPEEILRHFLRAKELGLNSTALYTNLSEIQMEVGDWEAAEKSISNALSKSPDDLSANYYKAILLLLWEKDSSGAVVIGEKMVEKNPGNPAAARILALALYKNGRPREAETEVGKAIEMNPDYCLLYAQKADIIKERSFDEAEALLNKAEMLAIKSLGEDKSDLLANYCLASVYSLKGDLVILSKEPTEIATAFYEQAMSVNIQRGKISDSFRQSAIEALGR